MCLFFAFRVDDFLFHIHIHTSSRDARWSPRRDRYLGQLSIPRETLKKGSSSPEGKKSSCFHPGEEGKSQSRHPLVRKDTPKVSGRSTPVPLKDPPAVQKGGAPDCLSRDGLVGGGLPG